MKQTHKWIAQGKTHVVEMNAGDDEWRVSIEERAQAVEGTLVGDGVLLLKLDDRRIRAHVVESGDQRHVWIGGRVWTFSLEDPRPGRRRSSGEGQDSGDELSAPISGAVVKMEVAVGDSVVEDQVLIIVEAMKMEHHIRAPRGGVVELVACGEGDMVDQDQVLVKLEPIDAVDEEPADA